MSKPNWQRSMHNKGAGLAADVLDGRLLDIEEQRRDHEYARLLGWHIPHDDWTANDLNHAARLAVSRCRDSLAAVERSAIGYAWEGCALAVAEDPSATWATVVDAGLQTLRQEIADTRSGYRANSGWSQLGERALTYWLDRSNRTNIGVPDAHLEHHAIQQVLDGLSARSREVILTRAACPDLKTTAAALGISASHAVGVVRSAREEAMRLLYDHEEPPRLRTDRRARSTDRSTCAQGHPWSENEVVYRRPGGRRQRICRSCNHEDALRRKGDHPAPSAPSPAPTEAAEP